MSEGGEDFMCLNEFLATASADPKVGYIRLVELLTVAEDADVAVVIGADGSDVMKTLPA